MGEYFSKLNEDYQNAEITSLFLHRRGATEKSNLLTIIELIPSEQEPSPVIGNEDSHFLDRESIDREYTVYLGRRIQCPLSTAINYFKNTKAGILLQHSTALNALVTPFENAHLEAEPTSEFPLIVNRSTEQTVGNILPNRNTAFRVWTKMDRAKNWMELFTEKQKEKLYRKTGDLTLKHLGFDISRIPEHFGNTYLCCCNPYLRQFSCSLLDHDRELLLKFKEREGKSVIGCKMVLEDKRAGNLSFSFERKIKTLHERIILPHFPDDLVTKIYDKHGLLIENHTGRWINISVGMHMQTSELNLTVKESGGKKRRVVVPKYSSERPLNIGEYDHSLTYYLKDHQKGRQIQELQKNKEFVFFPGGADDKERARDIIGELLNKASKRCMLLDPYFGAGDLFYAYIIRSTGVPIQIISSEAFLKMRIDPKTMSSHSNAVVLKRAFTKYKKTFPHQPIECKVLKSRSEKSPLHDRYIVVDESVFLLGSSLNEFGSRATTLIKVPAPSIMIDQAENWWNDTSICVALDDFVKALKAKK